MESNNLSDSVQKMLVNELIQGRDAAKQLQLVVFKEQTPSSSSNGGQDWMIQKIITCFERSIAILQPDSINQQQSQNTAAGTADSPHSLSGSPKSQDSDGDFKDHELRKSRKLFPLERKKMPGSSSSGLEQPVEDGYSWRKYGQKDILGAKYPRAYYRCTLRHQGCFATKQVQRSDDDPTYFEVTYRGKHACSQAASSSSASNHNPNPNPNPTDIKTEPIEALPYHHQQSHEIILSFGIDQKKDIKPAFNTANNTTYLGSPSFSFPSSSNPSRVTTYQTPTNILHNNNNFTTNHGNVSSNTYFSSSSSPMMMSSFDPLRHLEGEIVPASSTSTANTNSPTAVTPEFSFGQDEFDRNFTFESSHFFP